MILLNEMKKICFITICCLLAIAGCKETGRLDHLDMDAPAPGQISNVKVKPLPGGAMLTYDIPQDDHLSYVLAVYEIQPGVVRQAKSSVYTDTLRLDGFGDVSSRTVQLYSVGKNEKRSAPVELQFEPLTPPVQTVFQSMVVSESFGGLNIRFQNETSANLVVYVMVDTTGSGAWAPANTYFTQAKEGRLSLRGYESVERKFAVYIQDRWNNKSDTLVKSLVPLFEQEIPKSNWKNMKLPGDTWQQADGYVIEQLWNGQINWSGFASTNTSTQPQHFTIDLGQQVTMSRLKIFQFLDGHEHFYNGSALKKFEIYGSSSPDPDGDWDGWTLLGTFESYKPSGLPRGQVSNEDIQYGGVDGEDFEFETTPPSIRYLRLRTLESYSSFGQVTIGELTLFGRID